MEPIVKVLWTAGVKFHQSRFDVREGRCEACGKPIPSGMFIPIEALCGRVGLVGLWVGTDCAQRLFGVKDQGFDQRSLE